MYNWFIQLFDFPASTGLNTYAQYACSIASLVMFTCVCVLLVFVILNGFTRRRYK